MKKYQKTILTLGALIFLASIFVAHQYQQKENFSLSFLGENTAEKVQTNTPIEKMTIEKNGEIVEFIVPTPTQKKDIALIQDIQNGLSEQPSQATLQEPSQEARKDFEHLDAIGSLSETTPDTNNTLPNTSDCSNECQRFAKEDAKRYCTHFCAFPSILENIPEDCADINGIDKDFCLVSRGIINKDTSLCQTIEDDLLKDTCLNRTIETIFDDSLQNLETEKY